jgi:hypothetical protein
MHSAVFPENARSNRLIVLGSSDPYHKPASLEVFAGSDKLVMFVAAPPHDAVEASQQAVVLTRYVETFRACWANQHMHPVSRNTSIFEIFQCGGDCVPIGHERDNAPRGIL